ncbi:MAG: hypothetical protein AAFV25_01505 [Bacteroidota bacterium]
MTKQSSIRRWLWYAQGGLLLLCVALYLLDVIFGDGDGVNARFGLNPLKIFLCGASILLLVQGLCAVRTWLVNVSLLLLTTVLILGLLEWTLPWLAPRLLKTHQYIRPLDGRFPYKSYDSTYFKNYWPGSRFSYHLSEADGGGSHQIQINQEGIRGPERAARNADRKQLILLGDSFVQALQVPYEQTMGEQLMARLGDSVEVWQHGFPSWSPLLEWNWVLRQGMELQPDALVLFLYNNDFFSGKSVGDAGYAPFAKFDAEGRPTGFVFSPQSLASQERGMWNLFRQDVLNLGLVKTLSFVQRKRRAQQLLPVSEVDRLLALSAAEFEQVYREQDFEDDPLFSFRWDLLSLMRPYDRWDALTRQRLALSQTHLSGLHRSLAERSIPLYICLIPSAWQLEGEGLASKQEMGFEGLQLPSGGLSDALADFCQGESIPYFDLLTHFKSYKADHPEDALYFSQDRHLSPTGHRVLADFLHQQLFQQQGRPF